MRYKPEIKVRAKILRKKGNSIKEIADILGIAQSTSSLWLRNINLNRKAQNRLKKRKLIGQYRAHLTNKKKRKLKEVKYFQNYKKIF